MGFYRYPHTNVGIFFGSQQESFIPTTYKYMLSSAVIHQKPFAATAQKLDLTKLIFLHQTHGILGSVAGIQDVPLFAQEGDFLVTRTLHVGIAVATADCVPLVLYSTKHPVVAVVHAGWRGTVAGIIQRALASFVEQLEGDKDSVRILIGPAARVCCYQVTADFVQNLSSGFEGCVQTRDGQLFFDVVGYNRQLICAYGVDADAVTDTNICTMHEPGYCSHRASGGSPERQYTVVALK